MYHKILKTPSFHAVLIAFDQELAEKACSSGCFDCGGPLHQANYPRSPLGLPASCREHYDSRYSLCCGNCRKRVTPPSVRFFGRYRFPAVIMVLISAFMSRGSIRRYKQVTRYFGINISLRTWVRWRRWWQECFVGTSFWKQARALLPNEEHEPALPRHFLMIYTGRLNERLNNVLQFLAPLTAGVYRAV